MYVKHTVFLLANAILLGAPIAQANIVDQYASSVIEFSSQWRDDRWSAAQVLGEPDTLEYGDIPTSWAPRFQNGTTEFVSVAFDAPVYAFGATIRETWGNGFVSRIDVIDTVNTYHTVWSGIDPSQPGSPVDFLANWDITDFLVTGLKIYVNTDHNLATWEEIDSIQLHGSSVAPVPIPAAVWLFGTGLFGLCSAFCRKKRA